MSRGLLWLALADLRQAWLRSGLAALAIAAAILAVAFFAGQIKLHQSEVLASYEAAGAATFIVQLTGVADDEIDALAGSIRTISDVSSAEAPSSGISRDTAADTSFLVFRNEQQQEFLGARTSVLGVDWGFDLARDYYIDFHEINPQAPRTVLGMPLLVTTGEARPPGPQEVLVPSGVADYVGVQPGAEAIVEFVYSGAGEPIIQRFDGLRLIGTFDMAGPDQGRFEPFWRFNAKGQDVLTVRAETARIGITLLPIIVNAELFRDFLSFVANKLTRRGSGAALLPPRDQVIVRATAIGNVPAAEAAVERLLRDRRLDRECDEQRGPSCCLRLPERNNFRTALEEQNKVGSGGAFFVALLLIMLAFGAAGLQVQTVLSRWQDYGILQAVGFTPGQVLVYYGLQFALVLSSGIAIGAIASVPLSSISATSLIVAAGLAALAAALASLPVLFWPVWAAYRRVAPRRRMIWTKLVFGGFGRRGLEAVVALAVLAVGAAIVAGAVMVIAMPYSFSSSTALGTMRPNRRIICSRIASSRRDKRIGSRRSTAPAQSYRDGHCPLRASFPARRRGGGEAL